MSYILEALRKMERQKRKESRSDSLMDDITVDFEEEKEGWKNPGLLLIVASIFFGISGVVLGLLFYQGEEALEKDFSAAMESTSTIEKAEEPSSHSVKGTIVKSQSIQKETSLPKDETPAPIKSVTLSDITSSLPRNQEKKKVEFEQDRVIDLTETYRLTSTGKAGNRRYATIDRRDYYVGDDFMGMKITDIQKDRVHLREKASGQQYVIVFPYNRL